jgi:hypothetical protein
MATAIPRMDSDRAVSYRKEKCVSHKTAGVAKPNYQQDDDYTFIPKQEEENDNQVNYNPLSKKPSDDHVQYELPQTYTKQSIIPKTQEITPNTKETSAEHPRLAHINAEVPIGKSFMDGSKIDFIPHVGDPKKFLSYMSLELSYPQSEIAFNHLNSLHGPLINRAEAHLTIVTPPEFNNILSPLITMEELNTIALSMNVQSSTIKPICVGKGTKMETNPAAKMVGKDSSVWYVVVESEDVISIRDAIWKVFVERGGEASSFDPRNIWPHVTLGFQEKDWFPESNVFKTVYTCVAKLKYV